MALYTPCLATNCLALPRLICSALLDLLLCSAPLARAHIIRSFHRNCVIEMRFPMNRRSLSRFICHHISPPRRGPRLVVCFLDLLLSLIGYDRWDDVSGSHIMWPAPAKYRAHLVRTRFAQLKPWVKTPSLLNFTKPESSDTMASVHVLVCVHLSSAANRIVDLLDL